MFGKSAWFDFDARYPAPQPRTREGWIWYGSWVAVLALPVLLLLGRGQLPEAMIWALVSGTVCWLDLRQLRAEHRERDALSRLHYIGDEPVAGDAKLGAGAGAGQAVRQKS